MFGGGGGGALPPGGARHTGGLTSRRALCRISYQTRKCAVADGRSRLDPRPGTLRGVGAPTAALARPPKKARRRVALTGREGRACLGDRPRRQRTPLTLYRAPGTQDDQRRRVPAAVSKRR